MLANLYNVFNDIKGMQQFSFSNADLHTRQNAAILAQHGVDLSSYVLDPIPLETALPNWLQTHQEIHNQVNQVLGIAGNDLTENPDHTAVSPPAYRNAKNRRSPAVRPDAARSRHPPTGPDTARQRTNPSARRASSAPPETVFPK